MQLIYTSTDNTTIQATLDDKETLGNVSGPAVIFVPIDPGNAEYADILANDRAISPFVAPHVTPAGKSAGKSV